MSARPPGPIRYPYRRSSMARRPRGRADIARFLLSDNFQARTGAWGRDYRFPRHQLRCLWLSYQARVLYRLAGDPRVSGAGAIDPQGLLCLLWRRYLSDLYRAIGHIRQVARGLPELIPLRPSSVRISSRVSLGIKLAIRSAKPSQRGERAISSGSIHKQSGT